MVKYRMIRTIFKHELKPRHVFSIFFLCRISYLYTALSAVRINKNLFTFSASASHCEKRDMQFACFVPQCTCTKFVVGGYRIRVGRVEVISSSPQMYCNVVLLDFHCPVFSSVFVFKAGRNTQTNCPCPIGRRLSLISTPIILLMIKSIHIFPKSKICSVNLSQQYQIGLIKYINMMGKSSGLNNCLY